MIFRRPSSFLDKALIGTGVRLASAACTDVPRQRPWRSLTVESLEDRRLLATFHVSTTGNDADAGDALAPFRTIQRAVDEAVSDDDGDDMILVEGGNYNEAGVDTGINIPSEVDLDNLLIEGGYEPDFGVLPLGSPSLYNPQDAADNVEIDDDNVTIRSIRFTLSGAATGISINSDGVSLEDVSVTGAEDGIGSTGASNTQLIRVDSSNNTSDGVDFDDVGGMTTIGRGTYSGNGDHGLDINGDNAVGTQVIVDVEIVAENNSNPDSQIFISEIPTLIVDGNNLANGFNVNPDAVNVEGGPDFDYSAVDRVVVNGEQGADTFNVRPSTSTLIEVNGGDPVTAPGDVLVLNLEGVVAPVIPPAGSSSGTVTSTSHQELAFTGMEEVRLLASDQFEDNDTLATSTVLGSLKKITLRDLSILDKIQIVDEAILVEEDVDFFQYTAQDTGKLIINMFFDMDEGDLQLRVLDRLGQEIVVGAQMNFPILGKDVERATIPVVSQEIYIIEVTGENGANARYDLEIENFLAPVPSPPALDPADDTGKANDDQITFVDDARLFIQADLFDFDAMGIPILTAAEAIAGNMPGAAVEVFANGESVGFADPFVDSTLFEFTLDVTADLDPNVGEWATNIPLGPRGFFNLISASVRIFDGRSAVVVNGGGVLPDPAEGRSQLSDPLLVHFDPNTPNAGLITLDMLTASDSGDNAADNITSKMQPAFWGVAEVNTRIRIYANDELVGQGLVGSDRSDVSVVGVGGPGLGLWEITVEPLVDGPYTITVELEDVAGNVTDQAQGPSLTLTVDSLVPQRPTVDLVGMDVQDVAVAPENPFVPVDPIFSDTGMSAMDDVTRGFNPQPNAALPGQGQTDVQLRISAEANSDVVIKDGEQVVDMFTMPAGVSFVFVNLTLDEDPHPISVEAFDVAGNRSAQSEELLITVDVTPPPTPEAPDLIAASDTGMLDDDNVTSKMSPAFFGLAEKNTKVRVFAQNVSDPLAPGPIELVGQGMVNSDETDGFPPDDPLNDLGTWEVTIEPIDDGVYDITVELEDLAGNISEMSEALRIEIDTIEPNTAFLDLVETSDSGRHDDDNITNDNTPDVTMTSEDPNAAFHQVLFRDNLKFRIFDRFEEQEKFLLYDSTLDSDVFNVSNPADTFTSRQFILETLPEQFFLGNGANAPAVVSMAGVGVLGDGIHNLKLEVEDRAGNISHDFLFDLLIDTVAFEDQGNLHPDSDTGIWGFPDTMVDRYTSDKVPQFFGTAEADNLVIAEISSSGGPFVAAGTTVAVPLDGDDAFQPPNPPNQIVEGNWQLQTNLNLLDGEHAIRFTYEDPAGNRETSQPLLFFVDTQGPRITNVVRGLVITPSNGMLDIDPDDGTSLFEPKPSIGPDPLVGSIVIQVSDLPDRTDNFLFDAVFEDLADEEGNYQLLGDHNGNIAILAVDVQFMTTPNDGQPETAEIELVFLDPGPDGILLTDDDIGAPLPDDRFTLWVSDTIADPAGNPLDGESGAEAPFEGVTPPDNGPINFPDDSAIFPTGDGEHGGDFHSRFTVDSRPEVGVWSGGSVYVDTNGNFVFDPEGKDNDDTNEDIVYVLGFTTDDIFAGNFAGPEQTADGFDKLAAYGRVGSTFRWLIDTDNDGVPNIMQPDPANVNGLPVAGNFDGVAANGDEVAVFTGTRWHLDTTNNGVFGVDLVGFASPMRGMPIAGDFDGDGQDDLGSYNESLDRFEFDLANNGFGGLDETIEFGFPGIRETPAAADMDQDGIDDIGLYVPDRGGATPREAGEWYFLISHDFFSEGDGEGGGFGGQRSPGSVGTLDHAFTPEPFGNDLLIQFGDKFALPVLGNFDPPVVFPTAEATTQTLYQNSDNPMDVNGDSLVSAADVLAVINDLNLNGARTLPAQWTGGTTYFLDVNGDQQVSAADVLAVINVMNEIQSAAGAGSAGAEANSVTLDADPFYVSPLVQDEPIVATPMVSSAGTEAIASSGVAVSVDDSLDRKERFTKAEARSTVEGPTSSSTLASRGGWEALISAIAADVSDACQVDRAEDEVMAKR